MCIRDRYKPLSGQLSRDEYEILDELNGLIPVSYTHLDVYKRQVIGQAAVTAGLVSPLMVIIIALSAMTSFAAPDYSIMNAIRLLKFMLLFLTGTFGLFGFMMGINIIAIRVASTMSFGIPYTAPAAPFNMRDIMKFFFSNVMFEKERARCV